MSDLTQYEGLIEMAKRSSMTLDQAIETHASDVSVLSGGPAFNAAWLTLDAARFKASLYEPCPTCGGMGIVGNWNLDPEGMPDGSASYGAEDVKCPDCVDGEQPTTKAIEIVVNALQDIAVCEGWMLEQSRQVQRPNSEKQATRALLELRRQL